MTDCHDTFGRFIVGIDLGTTNCSLAYLDRESPTPRLETFPIVQLVAPGETDARPLLPSFAYLPGDDELPQGALALPWDSTPAHAVGLFAREQGARIPERLVSSAKSWLAHAGVDRTRPILPWGSELGPQMLSPVAASAHYLTHLRDAWNHAFRNRRDRDGSPCNLQDQTVILTVPASFDEAARELTLDAARQAGLLHVTLLEEPLAAFYAWLDQHAHDWKTLLQPGDVIAVIDVGGGTTDFSIIELDHDFTLRRKAVGDHLLLGGDNIDIALARQAERAWGKRLTQRQWTQLCQQCRQAKERLLAPDAPETATVQLTGQGSSILAGLKTHTFSRDDIRHTVLDGFFADIPADSPAPERRHGLQELGLPYAADPVITRHLLQFLRNAGPSLANPTPIAAPTKVLFNGGTMLPEPLRQHVVDIIRRWLGNAHTVTELPATDPFLAVSRGAAAFARARLGQAVRVHGGIAKAYFLQLDDHGQRRLLCVMPRDTAENAVCQLPQTFTLQTNSPVAFPLFSSATRLGDHLGDLIDPDDDSLTPLPPLQTALRFGNPDAKTAIDVHLAAQLTAIGTLELWCQATQTPHRFPLAFNLRAATATHSQAPGAALTLDEQRSTDALALIDRTFSAPADETGRLTKTLEETLALPRNDWPAPLLRRIADLLLDHPEWRSPSPQHDARWLQLLGFALRPGTGCPADETRIRRLWKLRDPARKLQAPTNNLTAWWIALRRAAAGLTPGQQEQYAGMLARELITKDGQTILKRDDTQTLEAWRFLASLEKIPHTLKLKCLNALILGSGKLDDDAFWPIARLAARTLFAGPQDAVIPATRLQPLLPHLLRKATQSGRRHNALLAIASAARRTGIRTIDLDDATRALARQFLADAHAPQPLLNALDAPDDASPAWTPDYLGDTLPLGLALNHPNH